MNWKEGIQTKKMKRYRRFLGISYKGHNTNVEVWNKFTKAIESHEDLLTAMNKRNQTWYEHVTRSTGIEKKILKGTLQGKRKRGRQRRRWEDIIT